MRQAVRLRPARPADAPAIARLAHTAPGPGVRRVSGDRPGGDGLAKARRRWEEALALPAGDDHFVLAALDASGALAGFAAAGGSRDEDGKGDGELYAAGLALPPRPEGFVVADALVGAVLDRLAEAGYARATAWPDAFVADSSGGLVAALARHGFAPDATPYPERGGARLTRPLAAPG